MPSLTVENYLKAIYQISLSAPESPVATGQLAQAVGVSPGTVTAMLKTLSDGELATYTPYEGVKLTPSGRALALRVVRRHRLIELFLVKTLDLSWDEVHEEAEHMEHAVSDRLIDRIDEFLGHPDVDPHGDPIPTADGSLSGDHDRGTALDQCPSGFRFRLTRVVDQSPDFLRFLTEAGIALDTRGKVVANRETAGTVTISIANRETALGRDAAKKLLVLAADE